MRGGRRRFVVGAAAAAATMPSVRAAARAAPGPAGGGTDLTGLTELRRRFGDRVILPPDAGYDLARKVRNRAFDAVRPRAVVMAASVQDVVEAVQWASAQGVPVVPRCGGHSYVGQSTTDGVVISLVNMAKVDVDPRAMTAEVGGGAITIDVNVALLQQGVGVPTGSCPSVGIGGLTLGGGIGFSSRKWGLMCDNLVGVEMVTAAGKVVTATETELPELLWACRGGSGGQLGIVTKFRFRVHEVEPIATFKIRWPWSEASKALDAWQRFAPDAPDGLFSVMTLTRGKETPTVQSHGRFFGSAAQLRKVVQPLVDALPPKKVTVLDRTMWRTNVEGPKCWPDPDVCHSFNHPRPGRYGQTSYKVKSDYFREPLSDEGRATLVRFIEKAQDQAITWGGIILDSMGGAIGRVPKDATAYVHRDQRVQAEYVAHWRKTTSDAKVAANLAWMRDFYAAMRPHASGECYQNYPDIDLKDWSGAYFGSNLARLQRCKDMLDPEGLFRGRHVLSPSA